jgi:hypothetical protein
MKQFINENNEDIAANTPQIPAPDEKFGDW